MSEEDRRQLGLRAADRVEPVLPLFEAKVPADMEPQPEVGVVQTAGPGRPDSLYHQLDTAPRG